MRPLQDKQSSGKQSRRELGFTLIELMIAIAVLGIGMLGAMILMVMGMQSDSRSKTDTTATVLDQEIIEFYSTIKSYPLDPVNGVNIKDCALNGNDNHETDLGPGLGVGGPATGTGAALYTAATAPTTAQIGDVDWTQPAPALATGASVGYAMDYVTCSGDVYEVRWNITDLAPANAASHLSLLTVSARPKSANVATANGAQNRAILFAMPVTLRALIEKY
jgi:prepilin-type N-terminal cleavage/methylation domain-containing protein